MVRWDKTIGQKRLGENDVIDNDVNSITLLWTQKGNLSLPYDKP